MGKIIKLDHITKIEGHAKLTLGIDKGKVVKCELSASEGARYFEGIVINRKYFEAHEITSRICGICSCAHTIAAISAIENAFNLETSEQTKKLRVLLTLGERIRSHTTHLYFLALPDYVGYESALSMASKYKKELKNALGLIKTGNEIIKYLGARDLHPVSATIGGWLKIPKQEDLKILKNHLIEAKKEAIKTCDLFSRFKYPNFSTEGRYFSLVKNGEYPVLDGKFASQFSSFEKDQYHNFIEEYHQPYSTSNFVVKDDHRYMVGALARINNNHKNLSRDAKEMLKRSRIKIPSLNPYHNIIAQAIELVHCIDHAIKICDELKLKPEKVEKIKPIHGNGIATIEVPRGTLWHEYALNEFGFITKANIITPTAQNLLNIQEDIREYVPKILHKKKREIIMDIEKLIRSYDPCFSCSAHFLEVKWV